MLLIPGWLHSVAFWGLLGCALVAVLYYASRQKRDPDELPRAEIASNRWRRRMLPWLPRLGLIGGLLGAWVFHGVSVDVIHVLDDDGLPGVTRKKHLGTPDFTLAPGQTLRDVFGDETWVYNESAQPVRIEFVSYGRSGFGWGPTDPIVIPPGTAAQTSGIDHIGPAGRPPSELQVEGVEARLGMTSRSWLTWDL